MTWHDYRPASRNATAGVVVHVEAVGTPTSLGTGTTAGHRAITGRCWGTAISEGGTTIFKKPSAWATDDDEGDG